MSVSRLVHQVLVEAVDVSKDVDTCINIKKRQESIRYRTLTSNDNVNLAYVISDSLSPGKNISISDRSSSVVQNRLSKTNKYVQFTGQTFNISTGCFLVTDVFTVDTPTRPATPLFYRHQLLHYNSDLADFSSRELLSYGFTDAYMASKVFTEYLLDTDTGYLYNNIENWYDSATTTFDATFIQYSIRYTHPTTGAITVTSYHELVSNSPVFIAASFDDIDEWGNILGGRSVYLTERLPGAVQFQVTMSSTGTYAYRETPESRICVQPPDALDVYSPWYISVTNGEVLSSQYISPTTARTFHYYLPEWDAQLYDPYPPYTRRIQQRAVWLTNSLIKVSTGVVWPTDTNLFVDVVVTSNNHVEKFAYTNNPSKIGTYYNSVVEYTDGILSIDQRNGFIELTDKILDTDIVYVSYFTEHTSYLYTKVDFNPVSNLSILDSRVVIYIVPESAVSGEIDAALFYLLVDRSGVITYCSQAVDGSSLDPSTQRLLNEDFYSDGTPRHLFYYDATSTSSGLRATSGGAYAAYLDEFSFIDKYTTESIVSAYNIANAPELLGGISTGYTELLANMAANPKFLVLADITVNESCSTSSVTLLDARVQGGGIKDGLENIAMGENPEVSWYWDIASNLPYPGACSFVVRVPNSLLTEYGGSFTYEQLRPIIEKHMAFGSYPVIRTYGIDPVLTASSTTGSSFTIEWPSYPAATGGFNVYYSTVKDKEFTLATAVPVANATSGNSYTVSGLALSSNYYLYLTAIDSDGYAHNSPVYRVLTLSA